MGSITTVYIPKEFEECWKVFKEITEREHGERGTSKTVNELVRDYVKKHGRGNPSFSLDKFSDPGFIALPTLGETPTLDLLDKMSKEDKIDLLKRSRAWVQTTEYSLITKDKMSRYEVQ